MPALPREFTELIADTDLPLNDESSDLLRELSVDQLAIVANQAVDLLGAGWGALLVALGVARARIPAPLTRETLVATPGFSALVDGELRLTVGAEERALVRQIQRALQAIAGRIAGAPPALALAVWGADGDYGRETATGVEALQRWRNLEGAPGVFGAAEATATVALLGAAPPPGLFDPTLIGDGLAPPLIPEVEAPSETLSPAVARIIAIAKGLAEAVERPFEITVQGRRYSYKADHFGVAPAFHGLLRAPGGYAYSVRPGAEYWKCNIFAGVVLALAEVPVPGHRVGQYRHFPRAERFGDHLAHSRGWRMIRHLDHRDPEDLEVAILGETQDAEVRALLAEIRPGDLFFADNPGPPGSDGGHARVCIAAADPEDPDSASLFAQARREGALLQRDGMVRLSRGRQIQFWLVRYTG